jgi:hypothetical protein
MPAAVVGCSCSSTRAEDARFELARIWRDSRSRPARPPSRPGSPMGYSSGAAEQEWKAQIKAVVSAAPRTHAGTGLLASFNVLPPTSQMPGFDLDNLLDPVLSAVINGRGWFGGRRPNLRWVAAQKEVSAAMPGLRLAVLEQMPRLWTAAGAIVGLDGLYRGELPAASAVGVRGSRSIRRKTTHMPDQRKHRFGCGFGAARPAPRRRDRLPGNLRAGPRRARSPVDRERSRQPPRRRRRPRASRAGAAAQPQAHPLTESAPP